MLVTFCHGMNNYVNINEVHYALPGGNRTSYPRLSGEYASVYQAKRGAPS